MIFKKLNLKDQTVLLVVNTPDSFEGELQVLEGVQIARSVEGLEEIPFALAFVTKQNEVDTIAREIAPKAKGDALIWFAYPKGSSKRYTCEFNRDTGWAELGRLGFKPVRQVAIDEDWSALRFRRVEFIRSMVRDKGMAIRNKENRGSPTVSVPE
jgi:hypothetical protein